MSNRAERRAIDRRAAKRGGARLVASTVLATSWAGTWQQSAYAYPLPVSGSNGGSQTSCLQLLEGADRNLYFRWESDEFDGHEELKEAVESGLRRWDNITAPNGVEFISDVVEADSNSPRVDVYLEVAELTAVDGLATCEPGIRGAVRIFLPDRWADEDLSDLVEASPGYLSPVEIVAAHELGHGFGLGHSGLDPNANGGDIPIMATCLPEAMGSAFPAPGQLPMRVSNDDRTALAQKQFSDSYSLVAMPTEYEPGLLAANSGFEHGFAFWKRTNPGSSAPIITDAHSGDWALRWAPSPGDGPNALGTAATVSGLEWAGDWNDPFGEAAAGQWLSGQVAIRRHAEGPQHGPIYFQVQRRYVEYESLSPSQRPCSAATFYSGSGSPPYSGQFVTSADDNLRDEAESGAWELALSSAAYFGTEGHPNVPAEWEVIRFPGSCDGENYQACAALVNPQNGDAVDIWFGLDSRITYGSSPAVPIELDDFHAGLRPCLEDNVASC